MKYPLQVDADSLQIPAGANCLICSKRIGEAFGFVRLTTGAILHVNEKKQSGGTSELMDSIFSLWFHGPHPSKQREDGVTELVSMDNAEFHMDIVERTAGGQTDIHFCSTDCLKKFFDSVVDSFEVGVSAAKAEYESRNAEQKNVEGL